MASKQDEITSYINTHRAHGPSWSPDGSKIAFVSDLSGLDQAWLLVLGEKEPQQLTYFNDRVGLVSWSPTHEHLLVTHDTGGNEHDQLFLLSINSQEPRPLTNAPDVIHQFGCWSPDGKYICYSSNQRHPAFFDTWILDIASGDTRCILKQDAWLTPLAWSSDGQWLVIGRMNSLLDNDLFLVSINEGISYLLTQHDKEAAYTAAYFAPDGQTLYTLTNHDREFLAPAALDLSSLEELGNKHAPVTYLVKTIWDADADLALSPHGDILAYSSNEEGISRLVFYHIGTGKELPAPALPNGVISGLVWAPDGTQLAFDFNGPKHCGNIWTAKISEKTATQITTISLMGLNATELVEPELIHYKSFDQLEIPAYYYRPKHSSRATDTGLPTIIFVHGGPEGQVRPVYSAPWTPPIQYYLQRGFSVLAPNVRGSTGYGKAFTHLDDVQLRMDSVADLKAAVHWLTEHGGADPGKIGIIGRSYGGFMVLAALTTYPELWAASVDIVGIANFVTFLENTGVWRRKLREVEYGSLEHDREFLEQISPIHSVDRITAPLLVVHGANDPHVPVEEAEQIVSALKKRNVPVKYLRYGDEGHYMLHQATQLEMYPAIGDWFEQYMG